MFIQSRKARTVDRCGADAGSVLQGVGLNNQGLRVKVLQDQSRGNEGAIQGSFVVLSVGDNMHAVSVRPLLEAVTNAEEIVEIIRRRHPGCVNIVNANILTPG